MSFLANAMVKVQVPCVDQFSAVIGKALGDLRSMQVRMSARARVPYEVWREAQLIYMDHNLIWRQSPIRGCCRWWWDRRINCPERERNNFKTMRAVYQNQGRDEGIVECCNACDDTTISLARLVTVCGPTVALQIYSEYAL
jgi:hypothetical protein